MADTVHRLNHALAHPDDIDDLPGLLTDALRALNELRFKTAPQTVVPNPNTLTRRPAHTGHGEMMLDSNLDSAPTIHTKLTRLLIDLSTARDCAADQGDQGAKDA